MPIRLRTILGLLVTIAPAAAHAGGGGGGLAIEGAFLPRVTDPSINTYAPGWLWCAGGTGYGFWDVGFRVGGEVTWCSANRRADWIRVNAQVGWRGALANTFDTYWTAYGVVGAGQYVDRADPIDDFRAITLHARAEGGVGRAMRSFALEVTGFVEASVLGAQFIVEGNEPRPPVMPTVGVRFAFLFGRLGNPQPRQPPAQGNPPPGAPPPPQGAPPPPRSSAQPGSFGPSQAGPGGQPQQPPPPRPPPSQPPTQRDAPQPSADGAYRPAPRPPNKSDASTKPPSGDDSAPADEGDDVPLAIPVDPER